MFSVPPGDYTSQLILPMTVGQITTETLRLYRQNFLIFFLIALLAALPGLVLTLILYHSPLAGEYIAAMQAWSKAVETTPMGGTGAPPTIDVVSAAAIGRFGTLVLGIFMIHNFLFRSLAIAATTLAVAEAYGKERATGGGALQALRHTGRLLGWGLLLGAMVLGPILLAALIVSGSLSGAGGGAFCLIMVLLLLSLFGGFFLGRLLFGARAIVAEDLGVAQAWRRTWQLTSTNYWRIFGIAVMAVLATWLIALVLNFLVGQVAAPGDASNITLENPVLIIVETLVSALLAPIVYISLTLLYYDERRLQESPAIGSGPAIG